MPDGWITYAKSLIANPVEFYSCFISHSREDEQFGQLLHKNLQDEGVRCWHYRKDAKWGKPVQVDIGLAIYNCDEVVVVCSESSLHNANVIDAIQRAIQREDKEKRDILFPIRIDDYVLGNGANKEWQAASSIVSRKYVHIVFGVFPRWNRRWPAPGTAVPWFF